MSHCESKFYIEKLMPLVGGKLTGFVVDGEYYGLVFTKPDKTKTIVWLYSDDEGNNPGSFELQAA